MTLLLVGFGDEIEGRGPGWFAWSHSLNGNPGEYHGS
jgi:hypothetical protein